MREGEFLPVKNQNDGLMEAMEKRVRLEREESET